MASGYLNVTSLITNKSRVIRLNYPKNPVDAMLPYDEIAVLTKIALECDLIVISGKIYEKIVYDGRRDNCLATFLGIRDICDDRISIRSYLRAGVSQYHLFGPVLRIILGSPTLPHAKHSRNH